MIYTAWKMRLLAATCLYLASGDLSPYQTGHPVDSYAHPTPKPLLRWPTVYTTGHRSSDAKFHEIFG